MDMWELLSQGKTYDAIEVACEEYTKDTKNPSLAVRLGVGYLWLREWDAAHEHFCHFTEVYPSTTDFAFKYAGTAKWCAGDHTAAVAEWKQGIDVDYADMGGGITIPLHLFYAAASDPDLMPMDEAVGLLQARLQAKPSNKWPGYLARLLLGELSSEEAVAQSKKDASHLWGIDRDQAEQSAKHAIDFWQGIQLLSIGDQPGYLAAMNLTNRLDWEDFDTNKGLLVNLVRSSELHLARYETERV